MNKNESKNLDKWGYKEDNKKLSERIDVHKRFSEKDIDAWMLKIIRIKGNEKILDIGCGDGKQILAFGKKLNLDGRIIGCDISKNLLDKAKKIAKKNKINASFLLHDINEPFRFKDKEFDFILAAFSIYYAKYPEKLILEIKRLLKKGGRLFIVGPTPNNTKDFWKFHSKIINKKIPQISLRRRARIHDIFIPLIKKHFRNIKIDIFKNTIHFPNFNEVLKYHSASLLFVESIKHEKEKKIFLNKMKKEIEKNIKKKGVFDIKKEVYGILAYK